MKRVSDSNYLKRAMNSVLSSFSEGIGSFVYNSAQKAPYQIRYEIVNGVDSKNNASGHGFSGLDEKVEGKFSGKLERMSEKIISSLDKAFEEGKIGKKEYNQILFSEMEKLKDEFAKRDRVFKRDFLSFAEYDMLNGNNVVPESDRNLGGINGINEFMSDIAGEARLVPGKPTPSKNEHRNETYLERHAYRAMKFMMDGFSYVGKEAYKGLDNAVGSVEEGLFWIGHQMAKHPIATITVAVPVLGAAADLKYNDGKITKGVFDSAKNSGKIISGGAASFIGDIGGMFKGNEAPVADFEITGNLTEGSQINIVDNSFDTDGMIKDRELMVNGKVTPTPVKLSHGTYNFSLKVIDDGGKSAVTSKVVEVQKLPRTDIKAVLGVTRSTEAQENTRLAKYLNESQKIPVENIKVLNENLTYDNFLKTVNEVGMRASDTDTIMINIVSDAGKGFFQFNKEGIKYDMYDGRTADKHSYKMIASAIMANTNPNAKKVIIISGCYSGSAIPAFKEIGIPNSAVFTSTTDIALSAGHDLQSMLTYPPTAAESDLNKDGEISFKELYEYNKKLAEKSVPYELPRYNNSNKTIPQLWDPQNITDGLILVDK